MILDELNKGASQKALCEKYKLSQSTLSTWKKKQPQLREQAETHGDLKKKRNRESYLPSVEKALTMWFSEMRSKPNPPMISNAMLVTKANL